MIRYSKRVGNNLLQEIVSSNGNIGYNVGELDADIMHECAMNPETRNLIQVSVGDVEEMEKSFEVWMETDTTQRKEYLENNLHKYVENVE